MLNSCLEGREDFLEPGWRAPSTAASPLFVSGDMVCCGHQSSRPMGPFFRKYLLPALWRHLLGAGSVDEG